MMGNISSYKMHHNLSRIGKSKDWIDGDVVTKHGIVSVYAQDLNTGPYYRFDFSYNGRHYIGSFDEHFYTVRTLTRRAVKFANDIVRGATQ